MKFRMLSAPAVVLSVVLGASGCAAASPVAVPSAAPTFATDEEAFAAAEETYRAYVDALNQVDLSDPATFEAVYSVTTSDTNVEARRSLSQMHADRWQVHGKSRATVVMLDGSYSATIDEVRFAVCLDVSDVEIVDASGVSVVSEDRPDIQSMLVTLSRSSKPWRVSSVTGREGEPSCG